MQLIVMSTVAVYQLIVMSQAARFNSTRLTLIMNGLVQLAHRTYQITLQGGRGSQDPSKSVVLGACSLHAYDACSEGAM